jgi:hypothetical protein
MACAVGFAAIISVFTQQNPIYVIVLTIACIALFSILFKYDVEIDLKNLKLSSKRKT